MMQAGFAVLEASFVQQKNSANIMMKNVADLRTGMLVYWATGWALSFGVDPERPDEHNAFVGTGQWFVIGTEDFGACNSQEIGRAHV